MCVWFSGGRPSEVTLKQNFKGKEASHAKMKGALLEV